MNRVLHIYVGTLALTVVISCRLEMGFWESVVTYCGIASCLFALAPTERSKP